MPFNIQEFISQVTERGLQKNNKFLVEFTPPQFMLTNATLSGSSEIMSKFREMSFWCDSVNLPGVQLAMRQTVRYGYGPIEKKPFAPVFNDMTLTLIGDGKSINWGLFHSWINMIVLFDGRNGVRGQEQQKIAPYEVFYKHDYCVDMRITAFNEQSAKVDEQPMRIVLREAFPYTMQDLPLNWSENNSIMRVPVTFTFLDWYWEPGTTAANAPTPNETPLK